MVKEVKIKDEYVTLGQFLKIVDLISTGGEAKLFLAENRILVNGEEDSKRGRKLHRDDLIEIDQKAYRIC